MRLDDGARIESARIERRSRELDPTLTANVRWAYLVKSFGTSGLRLVDGPRSKKLDLDTR
jgi:hypothetical protein